jgi:hypothetical protein
VESGGEIRNQKAEMKISAFCTENKIAPEEPVLFCFCAVNGVWSQNCLLLVEAVSRPRIQIPTYHADDMSWFCMHSKLKTQARSLSF